MAYLYKIINHANVIKTSCVSCGSLMAAKEFLASNCQPFSIHTRKPSNEPFLIVRQSALCYDVGDLINLSVGVKPQCRENLIKRKECVL